MLPTIDEIVSNFELLDEWEERYRYVIELGRLMEPLPDEAYNGRQQGPGLRQPGLARRPSSIRRTASPSCTSSATATPISCAASWRS